MNSDQEKKLYEYLDKVEKAQEELDRKTQRAEVYREYNIKLFSIIKIGIIGFIVFLTSKNIKESTLVSKSNITSIDIYIHKDIVFL